ncbi:TonB-dependent receptor [Novosphingobium bradum]|uniref:TonB-dependent receptor n=1 Tax=Novosphingobium bradum TaxID=1737444 RepID=A0ABV7IS34_9SPHN
MNSVYLRALLCASSAVAALSAVSAQAQGTPAPAATAPAADAAPVRRQDDMSDIIVTARRVEERLQDVPISITVFNQDQLAQRNVATATDLAKYTPSLQVDNRFGPNGATFAIRGFRQDLRTTASVGVFFADVVAPRAGNAGSPAGDGAGPGSFFDLQNVQVLKGPQGTLFGRNTTGGSILLVPQKPKDKFEGYVEGTYGNYDQKRIEAVINLPLSDVARFRVGVDWNDRKGYIHNISGIGPEDFGNLHYIAARASLVVDLSPSLENYTIVSYASSHDNGPLPKTTLTVSGPNCAFSPPASSALTLASVLGQFSCQRMARETATGEFYVGSNIEADPKLDQRTWQIINTTTLQVNDNLRLKNILSYSEVAGRTQSELFGGFYTVPATVQLTSTFSRPTGALEGRTFNFARSYSIPHGNTTDQRNVTWEFQIQGNSGDRLTYQAGAYYENSTPNSYTGSQTPIFASCSDLTNFVCTDVPGLLLGNRIGNVNYNNAIVSLRDIGLYAQATYAITDQLKLTGGFRYTWDRTLANAIQFITYFNSNGSDGVRGANGLQLAAGTPLPSPLRVCTIPGSDADCRIIARQDSKAPTWLLNLDYKPIEDVLLYAKYARGYRQGAVSYNAPPPYNIFKPERVDSYEVGLKSSFHGAISGTLNIAAFWNNFANQQLSGRLQASNGAAAATLAIVNAGKSRIRGLEVEAGISPFEGFSLQGNYAYIDAKVLAVNFVPGPVSGSPYDIFIPPVVAGGELPQTPKHKFSATASYRLPIDEAAGNLSVSATYTWTDHYIYDRNAGPLGIVPSFGLLNLNATWKGIAGSPIDAAVFATNVTGKKYFNTVFDSRTSAGFVSQQYGEPRFYGIRIKYNFGS